ncbi:MAG TPA: tetratricopeptide repeat protein [Rhodanobacteraceae bacterium]|nr:tetratricopeptide repeat protein [Rhodanobacteraceae bacterium]
MPASTPADSETLQRASLLLRNGQFAQARGVLEALVLRQPTHLQAHWLLGGACQEGGDPATAERAFRTVLALDPRWVPARVALGELLARFGRSDEAERELRRAHADDPRFPRAALSLAQLLLAGGHAAEALRVTTSARAGGADDAELLGVHGHALQKLNRHDEAIAALQRAAQRAPNSARAEHDLALALHQARHNEAAVAAARRALAKGSEAAETRGLLGRALAALGRYDEAESAFREAIARRADFVEAQHDLSQLLWLRHGDLTVATAVLDATLAADPAQPKLLAISAALHGSAGDHIGAHALFARAAALPGAGPDELLGAAMTALHVDRSAALAYARRADALAPTDASVQAALCDILVAGGELDDAASRIAALQQRFPVDQHMHALQATIWRLRGDPRYGALYDYPHMVRSYTIDTPPGWPDLASYLRDLAVALRRRHTTYGHPPDQSLRGGSQTMENLAATDDPLIQAFFRAIDRPIREHMAWLGNGDDPLRARNTGAYRLSGSWSVQLRPGGFHVDHFHTDGWLSSACYIELPEAVQGDDHAGWIKFGQPGLALESPLPAEHFVKPEPGLLVLFPSYMWHGTVPFSGTQTRLTIAFDVVPA